MCAMRFTRPALLITALLSVSVLSISGCSDGGDSDGAPSSQGQSSQNTTQESGDGVTEALEAETPTDTVDVPSADGAVPIAEYAAGGSDYEPADPQELAQILSIAGTDADGYLTADAVVIRTSAADATLLCKTADGMGISSYTVIPVLPDGTGVDCG